MLNGVLGLRAPTMMQPTSDDSPYTQLVQAVIRRALEDASGHVMYPGSRPPDRLEAEARAWLADGRELTALLELAGFDPAPVVRWVQRRLDADTERR
jgi:hypothetical protein